LSNPIEFLIQRISYITNANFSSDQNCFHMGTLSVAGRVFYGIAIAGMGLLTIYYGDFPYMLIPAKHQWIPALTTLAYLFGSLLFIAGACIVFEKKTKVVSLVLGFVLLLIFCFYFLPYQLFISTKNMHFGDWENAAKELALAGGAFVIAGCYVGKNESALTSFLAKLIPFGSVLFPLAIISFGFDHFLYARQAADYVPSWIPWHLFWIYVGGIGLLGSGLAIVLNIKPRVAAVLLGIMTLSWFVILHIPRVVVSPVAYLGSEVTSALIALAYSGIAFATLRKKK
jgi:uncharacterized membrane protein YphA (DoxX/SURF4 family)